MSSIAPLASGSEKNGYIEETDIEKSGTSMSAYKQGTLREEVTAVAGVRWIVFHFL